MTLVRKRQLFSGLRGLNVYVDGRKAASIRNGKSIALRVAPGSHSLEIRQDWSRSNTLSFDVLAGEQVDFECGTLLTGPMFWIFGPIMIWERQTLYLKSIPA